MTLSASHILKTTPADVNAIIGDENLLRHNIKQYYVLDPHELFDYCFPIDPFSSARIDIDRVCDDQAALHELFYERKDRPIVFREYFAEVTGISSYLSNAYNTLHSKSDLVGALIREADAIGSDMPYEAETRDALIEKSERYFNVILAINLGIYSLGAERFRDVYSRRLLLNDIGTVRDKPAIVRICEAYKPTQVFDAIMRRLSHDFRNATVARTNDNQSRAKYATMMRTARVDARVIDRILYLNHRFELEFKQGHISQQYMLLYFSSAARTRTIFNIPEVVDQLPMIDGKAFSIWRTRNQVFMYLLHKGKSRSRANRTRETVENLQKTKEVIESVRRMETHPPIDGVGEGQCQGCALSGGLDRTCIWYDWCDRMRELGQSIQSRREYIQNLQLLQQIQQYEKLIGVEAQGEGQEHYATVFSNIFRADLAIDAVRRVSGIRDVIFSQVSFAQAISIAEIVKQKLLFIRTGDEPVVSGLQALPLELRFRSKVYLGLYSRIREYCIDWGKKRSVIAEVMEEFFALDVTTYVVNYEHELMRLLLWTFGAVEGGDDQSTARAKVLMAQDKRWSFEFGCLLCWTLRRCGQLDKAIECAGSLIEESPHDGRLYHGRSLAEYARVEVAIRNSNDSELEVALERAIADTKKAIDCYRVASVLDGTVAVCYNNLAYFYCLQFQYVDHSEASLEISRKWLDDLKGRYPKESWRGARYEFYHTEAVLEWHEYQVAAEKGEQRELLRAKLTNALREATSAVDLYPHDRVLQLQGEISSALRQVERYQ